MTREFIVKEYQTFPYKGAVYEMPELIRCKDCAYYRPYSDGKYDCDNMLGMADAYEDGFCSRAERKEE